MLALGLARRVLVLRFSVLWFSGSPYLWVSVLASATLIPRMRSSAIVGLGCSPNDLEPFQCEPGVEWRMGMPGLHDADVVVLLGGDGTIHRHLGQLVRLGLPVMVVPRGSGNDLASSLGLPRIRDSLAA